MQICVRVCVCACVLCDTCVSKIKLPRPGPSRVCVYVLLSVTDSPVDQPRSLHQRAITSNQTDRRRPEGPTPVVLPPSVNKLLAHEARRKTTLVVGWCRGWHLLCRCRCRACHARAVELFLFWRRLQFFICAYLRGQFATRQEVLR